MEAVIPGAAPLSFQEAGLHAKPNWMNLLLSGPLSVVVWLGLTVWTNPVGEGVGEKDRAGEMSE